MKVIVGLGNPGETYVLTRHNVGFLFIDYLQVLLAQKVIRQGRQKHLESWVAELKLNDKLILAKPETYMNDSGRAVQNILSHYTTDSHNLVVVHDDLDIRFGEWKLVRNKGPKVHNGLNSIHNTLGTEEFLRLRFGIANEYLPMVRQTRQVADDFVLKPFTKTEQEKLPQIFFQAAQALKQDQIL